IFILVASGVTRDVAELIYHHGSVEKRQFEILSIREIDIEQNAPLKYRPPQSLIQEKLRSPDHTNRQNVFALEFLSKVVPLDDLFREDRVTRQQDQDTLPAQASPTQARRAFAFDLVPKERRRNTALMLPRGAARQSSNH